MKTDIAGSTPAFRALLAADQQALLLDHRAFVARHAADQCGQIVQLAGDGYWLKFPSVTAAAKSAMAMQDALRLAQLNKGDDRLSIRVVIGLGDIAMLEGVLIGDVVPLVVRIEAITPADEIYLTSAAYFALAPAEIQTGVVDSFLLKGFPQPITVYRVEQRHRTRIIDNAYILFSDLRGFTRLTESEPVVAVERVLDTLDTLIFGVAREFGGTVRSSVGDSYLVTYPEAAQVMAAADRLSRDWKKAARAQEFKCPLNIAVHCGRICVFRSFLYGEGWRVAAHVQGASIEVLADFEGGVFVTSAVHAELSSSHWHSRLRPVTLTRRKAQLSGLEVYRLGGESAG